MNVTLNQTLDERERDALVAYYIRYAPTGLAVGTLRTTNDLYEYLLLDAMVSGKVRTSRIAEAISSVQLYLHRCREGLEPGVDAAVLEQLSGTNTFYSYWDAYYKRYGTWAGLQRLLRYPASYLDPELRYGKTTPFLNLEQSINEGRLTEERAEAAIATYVGELGDIFEMTVVNGFMEEADPATSPMLFLARNNDETPRYYWRRAEGVVVVGTLNTGVWGQWMPVDAGIPPVADLAGDPNIVLFKERLYVIWLARVMDEMKTTGTSPNLAPNPQYRLELNVARLGSGGHWRVRRNEFTYDLGSVRDIYVAPVLRTDAHPRLTVLVNGPEAWTKAYEIDEITWVATGTDLGPYNVSYGKSMRRSLVYTVGDLTIVPTDENFSFPTRLTVHHLSLVEKGSGKTDFNFTMSYYSQVSGFKFSVFADAKNGNPTEIATITAPAGDYPWTAAFVGTPADIGAKNIQLRYRIEGSGSNGFAVYDVVPRIIVSGGLTESNSSPCRILDNYGVQSLDVNGVYVATLTSLAGPLFERRIGASVDALLSYSTQREGIEPLFASPPYDSPIRFTGANGLYMLELFFHVPWLIACRLLAEQRFDEAERWMRFIFSPSGYVNVLGQPEMVDGKPRYWNVVPLQRDAAWGPELGVITDDPDIVAANDPMHYKLAVYLRWLSMLQERGDMAYRQQTRDTLTEAKMWYMHALQLLGPRPYFHVELGEFWTNPLLGDAAATGNAALAVLDTDTRAHDLVFVSGNPAEIPMTNSPFLPPVDDAVLTWWDRFELRLYNLRNNLSLDGLPLMLPLYETPVSPRELQNRRLAGDNSGGAGSGGSLLQSMRFPLMLERARNAVQQLIQFGTTLQGILERRDADALSVLQQTHQTALLNITREVQQHNIDMLTHSERATTETRASAQARQRHYAALYDEHISRNEQRVMDLRSESSEWRTRAGVTTLAGAALDMAPNSFIAGMACGVGGMNWGAIVRATGQGFELAAQIKDSEATQLDTSEIYRRRREDWRLQRDQATSEIAQLDAQLDALRSQIAMAGRQADQNDMELGFAQAVLDTLSTRFTGETLFRWLGSRMATLYYQLYDAAAGLCAYAQASYQFESGNTTPLLLTGAWNDVYQGLMAGETLMLGLQRLENAHIEWNLRQQEVERTVSLDGGTEGATSLAALISAGLIGSTGTSGIVTVTPAPDTTSLNVSFELTKLSIDSDYPDTGKRTIKSVSVSIPAVTGPYEDIRASLAYTGGYAPKLPPGCDRVKLSHGLVDSGLFVSDPGDVKYLPFEGIPIADTGTFTLTFPDARTDSKRSQKAMLLSITDIIFHVRYTIHPGASSRTP